MSKTFREIDTMIAKEIKRYWIPRNEAEIIREKYQSIQHENETYKNSKERRSQM